MPYENTGDFLLNATPEDIKRMDEIFKAIKPYEPPINPESARQSTYLYWSSILNIKRSFKELTATPTSNTFMVNSRIDNAKYRTSKPNDS